MLLGVLQAAPALRGESRGESGSASSLCRQTGVTCFRRPVCADRSSLLFEQHCLLNEEQSALNDGLTAVPHMPSLLAHQRWVE